MSFNRGELFLNATCYGTSVESIINAILVNTRLLNIYFLSLSCKSTTVNVARDDDKQF